MNKRISHEASSISGEKNHPVEITAQIQSLRPDVRDAITAGRNFLLARQDEGGLWPGENQRQLRTTAEYIAMCAWFGLVKTEPAKRCYAWIKERIEDPLLLSELDVSTLALVRLAAHVSSVPESCSIATEIDALIKLRGGLYQSDAVARIYLAIFNQIPFGECDPLPPEVTLLPSWLPGSLAKQDRWSCAITVPLTILTAMRPKKISIASFATERANRSKDKSQRRRPGIAIGMRAMSTLLDGCERIGLTGLRSWGLSQAQRWILTRVSAVSGVAGSMTATALSAIALNCLGYERTSPAVMRCFDSLRNCMHADGGVAVNFVPQAESALVAQTLADVGVSAEAPPIHRAVEAILAQEVVCKGDWSEVIEAEPGGWSSEQDNDHYPDVLCTSAVLCAFRSLFATDPATTLVTDDSMVAMIRANSMNSARERIALLDRVAAASRRARRWLIAMQGTDGSWNAAFPSTSWNAHRSSKQQTGTVSATGLALSALGHWEMRSGQATVDRAVEFLRQNQSQGLWRDGHGCDYQTTLLAIEGLLAVGVSNEDPCIKNVLEAIGSKQNSDGGFGTIDKLVYPAQSTDGESGTSSNTHPTNPSNLLATAWALRVLTLGGLTSGEATAQAAEWLMNHQLPSGDWQVDGKSLARMENSTPSDVSCTAIALRAIAKWALAD